MFYGRIDELKKLADAYDNDSFESIAMYGRRRIGKSELIKESYKNFDCKKVYYECKKASEEFNVKALSDKLAEVFEIPKPDFKTLDKAMRFIFDKSINEKIIFVIDEYPYMRGKSDFLDSQIPTIPLFMGKQNENTLICVLFKGKDNDHTLHVSVSMIFIF